MNASSVKTTAYEFTATDIDGRERHLREFEGQALLILEAMKMQNEIAAPQASLVQAVHVREGQAVASGARLVTLASASIDGQE